MDINATLFGEILTFAILIWVMLKYIWPPIIKALDERQKKIARGLEAAERGQRDLELAQQKAGQQLRTAKAEATKIINQANTQALSLVEEGKARTQVECEKLMTANKHAIEQEIIKAKERLTLLTTDIALTAAEKILEKNVTIADQQKLIDKLVEEI